MNKEPVVESSGNVFADLGFSPEEATILAMRAELMARIRRATGCRPVTYFRSGARQTR